MPRSQQHPVRNRSLLIALLAIVGCADFRATVDRALTPNASPAVGQAARSSRLRDRLPWVRRSGDLAPLPIVGITGSITPISSLTDGRADTSAFAERGRAAELRMDLGEIRVIHRVTLRHAAPDGHPRRFRVETSDTPDGPGTPVFEGAGRTGESVARFAGTVRSRYLRLTVTEPGEGPVEVAELRIQ
jgi:hypothetical protein